MTPSPQVDYAALAEQARKQSSAQPPVDYAALAAQARSSGGPGRGGSTAPATKQDSPGFLSRAGSAFLDTINPMNSIPALYHSLTQPGEMAEAGEGLRKITPDEWEKYEHPQLDANGFRKKSTDPPPPDLDFDPAEFTGRMAGTGVNAALIGAATSKLPNVMNAIGRGSKKAAATAAEMSVGNRAIDRGFDKTPRKFIVEETRGIRPATVAASARQKLAQLNPQLEATYAAHTDADASLAPARNIVDDRILQAQEGNSTYVPPVGRGRVPELGQMRKQLTNPGPNYKGATEYPPGANTPIAIDERGVFPTGKPAGKVISENQTPTDLLRMKREFGKDFTKWNPLHPSGDMPTARATYGALDSELDRTVPEGADLNQRISSGISAAQRAEEKSLQAGLGQNLMHRVGAHTGAMTMGAGVIPAEVLALPATKMAGARALYGTGRMLQNTVAQRAAQAALLSGAKPKKKDDPLELFGDDE